VTFPLRKRETNHLTRVTWKTTPPYSQVPAVTRAERKNIPTTKLTLAERLQSKGSQPKNNFSKSTLSDSPALLASVVRAATMSLSLLWKPVQNANRPINLPNIAPKDFLHLRAGRRKAEGSRLRSATCSHDSSRYISLAALAIMHIQSVFPFSGRTARATPKLALSCQPSPS
jgi:hypothetical protein